MSLTLDENGIHIAGGVLPPRPDEELAALARRADQADDPSVRENLRWIQAVGSEPNLVVYLTDDDLAPPERMDAWRSIIGGLNALVR